MLENSLAGTACSRSSARGQVSSPTAAMRSLEASAVADTGSARCQPAASAKAAQATSTGCEFSLGPKSPSPEALVPQAPTEAAEVSEAKATQRKVSCITDAASQESCLGGQPRNPGDQAKAVPRTWAKLCQGRQARLAAQPDGC